MAVINETEIPLHKLVFKTIRVSEHLRIQKCRKSDITGIAREYVKKKNEQKKFVAPKNQQEHTFLC